MCAAAAPPSAVPRIGVALGGGGARGLAHVTVLEAFDDLGVKPARIAGTSIGAIVGAAYAAGLPAASLRDHARSAFADRAGVIAALFRARAGRARDGAARAGPRRPLSSLALSPLALIGNPVLVDAERLLDRFWPEAVPARFEDLAIPLSVVATDFDARGPRVIETGDLGRAVAASMAIPGLVRPVTIAGAPHVDGGAVDPLPFDVLRGRVDLVVAVDVTGAAPRAPDARLDPVEAMLGAGSIMQGAITARMIAHDPPDLLLRPAVGAFRTLDFLKARAVMDAGEGARAELRARLRDWLGGEIEAAAKRPRETGADDARETDRGATPGARALADAAEPGAALPAAAPAEPATDSPPARRRVRARALAAFNAARGRTR